MHFFFYQLVPMLLAAVLAPSAAIGLLQGYYGDAIFEPGGFWGATFVAALIAPLFVLIGETLIEDLVKAAMLIGVAVVALFSFEGEYEMLGVVLTVSAVVACVIGILVNQGRDYLLDRRS